MKTYILDRFEENFAVLEAEDGTTVDIPTERIKNAEEGDVVIFDGERYIADKVRTKKRRAVIAEKMRRLFDKKNPE